MGSVLKFIILATLDNSSCEKKTSQCIPDKATDDPQKLSF